eukprot:Skav215213  [mRNA]  locus=scaffold1252:58167:60110:- [translate_table: standard]
MFRRGSEHELFLSFRNKGPQEDLLTPGAGACPSVRSLLCAAASYLFALLAVEPRWHLAQRRKRRRAWAALRKASKGHIGRRTFRKLRSHLALLRGHHTWDPNNFPRPIQRVLRMGWHCSACNISNHHQEEYCTSCKEHWAAVWVRSTKRSGSRPRQRKEKKEKRQKEGQDSKSSQAPKTDSVETVFPTNAPWVTSTPQSRLTMPRQVEMTSGPSTIPPPPVLQPPPAPQVGVEPLTAEDQEMMKHLRGLKALNASLPPQLLEQLAALEEKEKAVGAMRPLSHGHINKLHKLQGQVTSQLNRIHKLDQEWRTFLDVVHNNMSQHIEMFRAHRAELLQVYQSKLDELAMVKQSVTLASRTLVDALPTTEEAPPEPAMQEDLQPFQEVMQQATNLDTVSVVDSEEMEAADEEETEDKPPKAGYKPPSLAAFKGSTSPNRVANLNLKHKEPKEKTKKETK